MMGWMAPLRHRRAKLVFLENHQEREPSMSDYDNRAGSSQACFAARRHHGTITQKP